MKPYITIVIPTRNDDYAGSMKAKTLIGLNDLIGKLRKCNFTTEIIIVEWNPPDNTLSIVDCLVDLEIPKNIELRVITVPNSIHRRYRGHEKINLNGGVATNVGIRRSKGEFVLWKAVDSFYSDSLIDFLSKKQLDKNSFYRVARYDINLDTSKHDINSINLENNIKISYEWNGFGLFTAAAGDFILMSKLSWFKIRGFPENDATTLLGVDNEAVWAASGSGLKQIVLQDGMKVYKIWHPGLFSTRVNALNYDSSYFKKIILKMPIGTRKLINNIGITLRTLVLGVFNLPDTTVCGVKTRSYFRFELICYFRSITFGGAFLYSDQWGLKSDHLDEHILK